MIVKIDAMAPLAADAVTESGLLFSFWENGKEESINNVEERFLFVPFNDIAIQNDLLALATFLMTHFKQDTIIFYDPDSSILLLNQDHITEITEFDLNKMNEMLFSKKRINSDNRFVIDGRVIPNGFLEKLKLRRRDYIF